MCVCVCVHACMCECVCVPAICSTWLPCMREHLYTCLMHITLPFIALGCVLFRSRCVRERPGRILLNAKPPSGSPATRDIHFSTLRASPHHVWMRAATLACFRRVSLIMHSAELGTACVQPFGGRINDNRCTITTENAHTHTHLSRSRARRVDGVTRTLAHIRETVDDDARPVSAFDVRFPLSSHCCFLFADTRRSTDSTDSGGLCV